MINGGALNAAPINAPFEEAFVDWAAGVEGQVYYAMEIDDGILDPIRIPISSWQGTVQTGRKSYVQAVIPGADAWAADVAARPTGELIIYRGLRATDGETQEAELARAPIQAPRLDRGPTNVTMTISGYATLTPPTEALTRTLQNVRSESTTPALRARCDIDFFLRPGQTATSRGTSFVVRYINYQVNDSDAYMDVGEDTA